MPEERDDGRRRPLVLGYHAISSSWASPLAVSESVLRAQLRYLRKHGYVGLTLTESELHRQAGTLPRRAVVVTFDDGYESTARAAPLLAEVGFPGTVFLVTSFVDSGESLSWPGIDHPVAAAEPELRPLGWTDAEALVAGGWEVGSHTATHPLLTQADDERLGEELQASRTAIERRLGRCTSLAYPYGIADERVAAAAALSGYTVACTLTFAHVADEPLRRPRVGLGADDTGVRLALQVSRLGGIVRRSSAVRVARRLRRRRAWLPD